MKIKVCGMREPENLAAIAQLNPDYVGLIFHGESPRNALDFDPKKIPPGPKRVGVFVDAKLELIMAMAGQYGLDLVQLHGQESPGDCAAVRGFVPVVKAFRVGPGFDFAVTDAFAGSVDFFLFDAQGPLPGGNGTQFDWTALSNYQGETPFFLAGGIKPDDVPRLLKFRHARLHAVDLNSGFEQSPGHKSEELLRGAIAALRPSASPDIEGYYGQFGGAFIPEMLHANVEELAGCYQSILQEPGFQSDFMRLLKDYAGRATPLYLAERLSKRHGARIFLKREDLLHTGAHKLNNTIGQVLLAERLGKKRVIAETGAGQHGVATATVCALRGLDCVVYMGAVDMRRQAPNVARMRMLGAQVVPALSGSQTLKDATNEAIRDWIAHPDDTHYIIGSVVGPHPYPDMVARFQSVISEEIMAQLQEQTGSADPDMVLACVGGGSNAAGAFYHYIPRVHVALVMAEAAGLGLESGKSAATSFLGKPGILHGSHSLLMQSADGQVVEPHSISAGLDYPGIGPLHAHLLHSGRASTHAITDAEALEAAFELARMEGIIPALESAHALACLPKLKLHAGMTVVVNLSGRGDKDLSTYITHLDHAQD